MTDTMPRIAEVQGFWNDNPCQAGLSTEQDRRRYFDEISRKRFGEREWHVPTVANFAGYRGKDVLEIGCGIATDGLEFAKHGARYVGVDLTQIAIEMATERFKLFGVAGRFELANAEDALPFPDASFDHIYSFGVIHHSPSPERIVAEMHRVLRPRGTFTVMLYNRSSVNYYVEIMFLRKVFRWMLIPRFMPALIATATGFDRWKLEGHRTALTRQWWIPQQQWISMNTDGPFCPLSRVYSHDEAGDLFKTFVGVRQEVWEFNADHWPFVRRVIPDALARRIGRRWGWHRMIYGEKA
jgi:ubiquinone/menaquinone biosynthesis C-methylase UbiE